MLILAAGCSGSTSAPAAEGATRLAVIGDFGTGGRPAQEVADLLRERHDEQPFDALVTTGDNVYPDGAPEDFDSAWERPYGWVEEQDLPVFASLGNHDVSLGHEKAQLDLFDMPGRWYEETVGLVQLVVLDANIVDEGEQAEFLRKTLDAPLPDGALYRVLVFHQPPFSCREGDEDVLEEWVPLIEKGEVDLVLNGHDHSYQRYDDVEGTTYVVTGGGGANLYEVSDCEDADPPADVAESAFHHVEVDADAESLRLRAVEPDGELLDETTVVRR